MRIMQASKEVVKELMEKKRGKILTINVCAEHDLTDDEIKEYRKANNEDPEIGCLYVPDDYGIDKMRLYLISITNAGVYSPAVFQYLIHGISLEDWEVNDDGDNREIDTIVIKFMKKYDVKLEAVLDVVYKVADQFRDKTIIYCDRQNEKKSIFPFKKKK